MDPFKIDINDTTRFLLPLMFPNNTYSELFSEHLEEAYIGMLDDDTKDDTLILKFKHDLLNDLDLQVFMEEYDNHVVLDSTDNLIVYEIPEELEEIYNKFLNGEWSKFPEESKQNIIDFWETDEDSLLYGILYKTEKGQELISTFVDPHLRGKVKNAFSKNSTELWKPPDILSKELLIN